MTSPSQLTEPSTTPLYTRLHHLESSQSIRVLTALEDLNEVHNLQYRLRTYPRKYSSEGTKVVHLLGKSPILCIGPNPEDALSETRLILQHLADTYSKGICESDGEEDKKRDLVFQEFANASLLMKVS